MAVYCCCGALNADAQSVAQPGASSTGTKTSTRPTIVNARLKKRTLTSSRHLGAVCDYLSYGDKRAAT